MGDGAVVYQNPDLAGHQVARRRVRPRKTSRTSARQTSCSTWAPGSSRQWRRLWTAPTARPSISSSSRGALLRPAEAEGALTADPHVWLDPIATADRHHDCACDRTASGAASLVAKLRALDVAYRAGLMHCDRREIVTTHAAFGYLARRYGLEQIPLSGLTPEAAPPRRTCNGSSDKSGDRLRRQSSSRRSSFPDSPKQSPEKQARTRSRIRSRA